MPFSNLSSYALGLVFIILVAIIWSIASVVVQYLYRDQSFDAPFLLTYIGTSLFVVQLPLHFIYKRWVKWRSNSSDNRIYENISSRDEDSSSRTDEGEESYQNVHSSETNERIYDGNGIRESGESDHHWTEKDHMIAGAKIAPFWFISNFAYNTSLQYTSITSSTVLVNTGSLFTFLIALFMRDERFSCWKLVGVLFGILGCVVTGLHDARNRGDGHNGRMRFLFADINYNDTDDDNHILGDMLSVISAAFYGIYAVMVRLLCPKDESLMSMQLFFGYVGLWNMLALFPVALYQVKIAQSVTLSTWVFGCLVVNGLFNSVISDYLWARSVVLTSATVASVGLGLTIPLAFVSDVFLGVEDILNLESILGACFVLSGFILVNIGQTKTQGEGDDEHHRTSSEVADSQSISMQPVSSEIDMALHQNLS
mmetsp:Transcript_4005/g.10477  ORF Transcript_4005/g.10477 Transcript_4005/m.10477 type:complete len:426 (+) Transcript_4005:31-1308(+)